MININKPKYFQGLKYWKAEQIDGTTYRVFLKAPLSSEEKFIIYFHKGLIPMFNRIILFRDKSALTTYFYFEHKTILVFRDNKIDLKNKVFRYPFTEIIEDDFTKGIILKVRSEKQLKKILHEIDKKYEILIRAGYDVS